jgi:hypothetical protein
VAWVELKLRAEDRLGQEPGVLGRDRGIGIAVVDRCRDRDRTEHAGQVLDTWYAVPSGSAGGNIWSRATASSSGSDVRVSTGECDPTIDTCPSGNQIGYSLWIVHLSWSLGLLQAQQAPGTAGGGHDRHFGSSPALFGSGSPPSDVGACNKNGLYWALAANPLGSAPLRVDTIGAPSARATCAWLVPSGTGRPVPWMPAAIPPSSAGPATVDRYARSTRRPVPAPTCGRPARPAR